MKPQEEREQLLARTKFEFDRLKWPTPAGRQILYERYGKQARSQLSLWQLRDFLQYLRTAQIGEPPDPKAILDVKIVPKTKWVNIPVPVPIIQITYRKMYRGASLLSSETIFFFPHLKWVKDLISHYLSGHIWPIFTEDDGWDEPTSYLLWNGWQEKYLEHLNWVRNAYELPPIASGDELIPF